MDPGRTLTAETTAVLVSSLHWASKSLFELFVSWASEVEPDRGDVASWLSSTGRHLGEQAQSLAGLMPDSVLLADSTGLAAPSVEAEEALRAVRAIPGSVVRLAIAHRVLLTQLSDACEALQQLAEPHADAPLLRVLGFLLLDIANDRERAELLLGSFRGPETDPRLDEAVSEVENRLASAGGLVPAGVLHGT
ncbi:MAG: hypothetical protein OXN44_10430 [Acidimicrobiaceae bacterium]|nr:hypothetical protein [Acidimicrobiaceae bacterium]MDE0605905.1 hypothetical protein [Acidimicrobiaceae bacterium]